MSMAASCIISLPPASQLAMYLCPSAPLPWPYREIENAALSTSKSSKSSTAALHTSTCKAQHMSMILPHAQDAIKSQSCPSVMSPAGNNHMPPSEDTYRLLLLDSPPNWAKP
jgi:hypothetical protein